MCIFVQIPMHAWGDQHSQIEKLGYSKSVLFLISFPGVNGPIPNER